MGLLCPELVAVFFDAEGEFLMVERRPWDSPAPLMSPQGPYRMSDRAFRRDVSQQIQEWQTEIGFHPGTIQVRPFNVTENLIKLEQFPEYLEAFRRDPKACAEDL